MQLTNPSQTRTNLAQPATKEATNNNSGTPIGSPTTTKQMTITMADEQTDNNKCPSIQLAPQNFNCDQLLTKVALAKSLVRE